MIRRQYRITRARTFAMNLSTIKHYINQRVELTLSLWRFFFGLTLHEKFNHVKFYIQYIILRSRGRLDAEVRKLEFWSFLESRMSKYQRNLKKYWKHRFYKSKKKGEVHVSRK